MYIRKAYFLRIELLQSYGGGYCIENVEFLDGGNATILPPNIQILATDYAPGCDWRHAFEWPNRPGFYWASKRVKAAIALQFPAFSYFSFDQIRITCPDIEDGRIRTLRISVSSGNHPMMFDFFEGDVDFKSNRIQTLGEIDVTSKTG